MYQKNKIDKGTEFIIPGYHQFDAGPFLFIKKTIKNLEIDGGVRYDVRVFNNDALNGKPDASQGLDKPV